MELRQKNYEIGTDFDKDQVDSDKRDREKKV
jgi:hypothetical protein